MDLGYFWFQLLGGKCSDCPFRSCLCSVLLQSKVAVLYKTKLALFVLNIALKRVGLQLPLCVVVLQSEEHLSTGQGTSSASVGSALRCRRQFCRFPIQTS